jgi:hypothetical protein
MNAFGRRLFGVVLGTAVIVAGVVLYIVLYLTSAPPTASAVSTPSGPHLYLGTVPAAETNDAHPTWVSYYSVDANSQHWVHATTYKVPAHTVLQVTIYQYDGASGLRNEFLGQVRGTIGGTIVLNGKTTSAIDPASASHVFSIPQLNLSVPLEGVSANAKNPCANAPCGLGSDHMTIQFSFRTPGPGLYRWQCFVPCAAGYIQGLGGPMQTVGYMDGYLKVV